MYLPKGFVNYPTINLTTRPNRLNPRFKAHAVGTAPLLMVQANAQCGCYLTTLEPFT